MQNTTILLSLLISTSLYAEQPTAEHQDYSYTSKTEVQSNKKSDNKGFIKNHPKTCAALTVLTVLGGVLGCLVVVRKRNFEQGKGTLDQTADQIAAQKEWAQECERLEKAHQAKIKACDAQLARLRQVHMTQEASEASVERRKYEEELRRLGHEDEIRRIAEGQIARLDLKAQAAEIRSRLAQLRTTE